MRLKACIPSSLLMTALAATLVAQESASRLFVERVDVNVVNVEVWVTDSEGRSVTGLAKDDFELFEDGEPVEVANFYATERPRPWTVSDETRASARVEESELPADQILHLTVLVDNANSLPANRNRALDDLEPFLLERARQGDRLMLMNYDSGLHVVEPFTQDAGRLRDGLKSLRKARSQKPIRDAERNRRLRGMLDAEGLTDVYAEVRAQVQQEEQELQATARALQQVVQSLSGLPGRKALLYLSDGLPKRPGEAMYEQMTAMFGTRLSLGTTGDSQVIDPFLETLQQDQTPLFDRISRAANANQVTLYTVDMRGAAGTGAQSPANPGLALSAGASVAAAETLNYQETLLDMSVATGGRTVLGTFNFDAAMSDVAEDFDSFYSLGYVARQGGDGKFHEITVRVKDPGLKVRHRRGYVAKPALERVSDRVLSSLVLGAQSNPLGVAVDFGSPEKTGRKAYDLPVLIRLPLANVALLPTGERSEGRLRIFLAVKDEEGRISDVHEFEYPIAVPNADLAQALEATIGYTKVLKIRPGVPVVVVGVWDEVSGSDSFVLKQVRVGAKL